MESSTSIKIGLLTLFLLNTFTADAEYLRAESLNQSSSEILSNSSNFSANHTGAPDDTIDKFSIDVLKIVALSVSILVLRAAFIFVYHVCLALCRTRPYPFARFQTPRLIRGAPPLDDYGSRTAAAIVANRLDAVLREAKYRHDRTGLEGAKAGKPKKETLANEGNKSELFGKWWGSYVDENGKPLNPEIYFNGP